MGSYDLGLAQVLAGKGEFKEADRLFQSVVQERLAQNNPDAAAQALQKWAESYRKRGEIDLAVDCLNRAIQIYDESIHKYKENHPNDLLNLLVLVEPKIELYKQLEKIYKDSKQFDLVKEMKKNIEEIESMNHDYGIQIKQKEGVWKKSKNSTVYFVYNDGFTRRLLQCTIEIFPDDRAFFRMEQFQKPEITSGLELDKDLVYLKNQLIEIARSKVFQDKYPSGWDDIGFCNLQILDQKIEIDFPLPENFSGDEAFLFRFVEEMSILVNRLAGQVYK